MSAAMRQRAGTANDIANVDGTGALPSNTAGNSSSRSSGYTPPIAQQTVGSGAVPTVQVRPVRLNFVPRPDASAASVAKNSTAAAPNADPVKELISMLEAQQTLAANAKPEQTVAEIFQSLYGTQS